MFETDKHSEEVRQLRRIADTEAQILRVLIQVELDLKQLIAPQPVHAVSAKIVLGSPVNQ